MDEPEAGKRHSQCRVVSHWLQAHRAGVLVDGELDLGAEAEPEPIAKNFGPHDLPFRSTR
jgi:hypothetical protein